IGIGFKFKICLKLVHRNSCTISYEVISAIILLSVILINFNNFISMSASILPIILLWPTHSFTMKEFPATNLSPIHVTCFNLHYVITIPPQT
ncbi:hypothetical protein EI555_020334, partial [Monodon monoceros]